MKTKFTLLLASMCLSLVSYSQYCNVLQAPYAPQQPGITNFKMGTINRTSTNVENNVVHVQSSVTAQTATFTIGQTYSISITASDDLVNGPPLTGAPQNKEIYIDFNQNLSFTDPGETAVSGANVPAGATYTANLTIPAGATPGTTKMRVTAKMGATAGHTPPTPCNSPPDPLGYHGEIEDYIITLVPAGPTAPAAAFVISPTVCVNSSNNTTNNTSGSPAPTYTWSTNPAATISSPNASNPAITFTAAGTYTVVLTASNTAGSSTTSQVITAAVCGGAPAQAAFVISTTACVNSPVNTNNSSSGAPAPTYTWSTNPVATISNSNALAPTITFPNAGTYTITLEASNASGSNSVSHIVTVSSCVVGLIETNLPINNISLFPNPFNQTATLFYQTTERSTVSVIVYNILGEQMASMVNEEQNAGSHQIVIDKNKFIKYSSGIYFIELVCGNSSYRSKIVITD